jgi:hypothetical protein
MNKILAALGNLKNRTTRPTKKSLKKLKLSLIRYIASKIYRQKLLKQIWESKHLGYGPLLSTNYWETFPDRDDYSPILVPEPGFPVNNASLKILGKEIILETELPLKRGKGQKEEMFITAAGMMFIQDPVEKLNYNFRLVPVQTEKQLITNQRHLKLKAAFSRNLMTTILSFRDRMIFLVLVTLDENGNPVNYSRQIKEYDLQRIL